MKNYSVSEVVHGLRHHQIRLALEPQVNLKTGEIVGMECLVRWHHPECGVVSPAAFLPQLEISGLLTPLTFEVLTRMLSVRKQLRAVGYTGRFSINVSNKTLLDWTFARDIRQIAHDTGETLGGVTFEITESSSIADDNLCSESLQELAKLGIALSLDDFWTGYSSLNKPDLDLFGEVKIDYNLTSKIHDDRVALAGVASIVTFAKNLNWHCVIEGIERADTIHRLLEFGCEIGQGYFLSRPIPEAEVVEWFISNTVDQRLCRSSWTQLPTSPTSALPLLDESLMTTVGAMKMPVWCFNVEKMQMEWANGPAVAFWRADDLRELLNRNFSADLSTTARERIGNFRDRLKDGSQFAEQWTVFPKGVPTPVYCVFSLIVSPCGDELLLIKGFEGFLSVPKSVDHSQFAEAANIPAVAMTLDARIYWRNIAAAHQFGSQTQFLVDVATQMIDGSSLLERVLACGAVIKDLLIQTGHCNSWFRVNARTIRDENSGDWSILLYLTSICDLRGCSLSAAAAPSSSPVAHVLALDTLKRVASPRAGRSDQTSSVVSGGRAGSALPTSSS